MGATAPPPPRLRITTRAHFSAAHRLHNDQKEPEWNRRIFDKCNNPFGHGHTYEVEVTVEGPIDAETGWVMDFGNLKRIVDEKVIRPCDRRNLNTDVPFLSGVNPTAENIAMRIFRELDPEVGPARLVRVVLHETERNRVAFTGPPA